MNIQKLVIQTTLSLLSLISFYSYSGENLSSVSLSKPFHEYSWLTAHNAHASTNHISIPFHDNQSYDMTHQLNNLGVRGLMIDIQYKYGEVMLVHSAANAGNFIIRMTNEILPFLKNNKNSVLTFDVEVTEGKLSRTQFLTAMKEIPWFTELMFNPYDPRWNNQQEWPSPAEMISANQRIIFMIDKKELSGSFTTGADNFYVFRRSELTMENMWAEVGRDSCEERHGYEKDKTSIGSYENMKRKINWTRLFTMNHFRNAFESRFRAGDDNNWDGLYPRIKNCMTKNRLNRKPNYIAMDFVHHGDGLEVSEVLTDGGIILYEGNNASQNIVCGLSAGISRNVNRRSFGCENDEARSAELVNTPANTTFRVFDSPSGSTSDDYFVLTVKKDLSEGFSTPYVVQSFEQSGSNGSVDSFYSGGNGLDGKVSYIEVRSPLASLVPEGNVIPTDKRANGFWGTWGSWMLCPAGEFVYGYRLKSEKNQDGGDDTGLNAVELKCKSPHTMIEKISISSSIGPYGSWSNSQYCLGRDNPVTGFAILIEKPQGRGDDTAANDVDLYCRNGEFISAKVSTRFGNWKPKALCPSGQAVAGIKTRVEQPQGGDDDTALNGVHLLCKNFTN